MPEADKVKEIVKKKYADAASTGCGCRCGASQSDEEISKSIGYSDEELTAVGGANMGLGCGNPVAFSKMKAGDTVVDLGSGGGIDCFLAAKKVGSSGRVIGVDMTEEMVQKATANAAKQKIENVEFIVAEIEKLPVADNSVDVIISNCVINLAPDKAAVFREAQRALKAGGKMFVSDIVLLGELTEEQKNDEELLAGCVAGALLKDDYIKIITDIGFEVEVLNENKGISKEQYQGIALESLLLEITKKS
ncbi:MAG: arsenite methyltransferase [Candidatus Kerfeldbacteria bacterium]